MAIVNGLSLNSNTNLVIPEHGASGVSGSLRINSTTKALEIFSGGNFIPIKFGKFTLIPELRHETAGENIYFLKDGSTKKSDFSFLIGGYFKL